MKKILFGILFFLASCTMFDQPPAEFEEKQIQTEHFSIYALEKKTIQDGKPLRLYIEGDGMPNPRHPIAKHYALKDTDPNVIYIARPCQWVKEKICEAKPQIYQTHRFDPDIIAEMQELVEYLMRKHKAPEVEFVGYDGGAAISLILATRVPTKRIITIAGIIDTDKYAAHHGLIFPQNSLNPADLSSSLTAIPQVHYVGQHDDETPRRIVERFVLKLHNPKSAVVKIVPDIAHTDWEGVSLDY